jgi:hypothetical protein
MNMENSEKFLFQLTTKEFIEIYRNTLTEIITPMVHEAIAEHLNGFDERIPKKKDSVNAHEAAEITGLKVKSIYSKVSRMEMPTISRGRPLMFSRKELERWLKEGKPTVGQMMFADYKKKKQL